MLFYTIEFLFFSIILFIVLYLNNKDQYRKLVFLVFSYVFYMWWNPIFILLIIGSTIIDFLVSNKLYKEENTTKRKSLLLISIIGNLSMLGFFKYYNFFEENLFWILKHFGHEPGWTSLNVILPVGISFFTFQTMSYTIDVYRRELKPATSILDFALFASFFPQLLAGPIVRASDFLPQLNKLQSPFQFQTKDIYLILKGVVKKVIIADNLAYFVDMVFNNPGSYPSIIIIIATIAFSIQIYCDFSGYSDMAIGIASILGFRFPINFNKPYFSKTPSEFWQRWHISLSTWLRDYLYIPLGGNRNGKFLTYRNLFLTMLLGGLWHGASWNFVIWGAFHGAILIFYRVLKADNFLKTSQNNLYNLLATFVMLYLILISWIFFRNSDIDNMIISLQKFIVFDFNFSIQNIGLGTLNFFSTILIMAFFGILHYLSYKKGEYEDILPLQPGWLQWSLVAFAGLTFYLLWPLKDAPFIYFQF